MNAGDAMTIAQVAIGLLRQQLEPGDQVHGIVTNGGSAANIIPAHVTGRFMCRSVDADRLGVLRARVDACFEAGAKATGATLSLEEVGLPYSHMVSDAALLVGVPPPRGGPRTRLHRRRRRAQPHRRSRPTWRTCRS